MRNNPSPLKNKTILITRAAHQYAATASLVRTYQAIPQSFPCLVMQPLPQTITLGLASLQQASDVLFTSANAVNFVQDALQASTFSSLPALLQHTRIACVGKKTANSLKKLGVGIHLMPSAKNASQQGMLDVYQQQGLPRKLVFFRAEEGSNFLMDALNTAGVFITLIPTYRSICPVATDEERQMREQLKQHHIDAVLLASSRTAAHYVARINNIALANTPIIIAISAQVAEAAKPLGLHANVIAKAPSFSQMMVALSLFYSSSSVSC